VFSAYQVFSATSEGSVSITASIVGYNEDVVKAAGAKQQVNRLEYN
jgi:hypothetical protein